MTSPSMTIATPSYQRRHELERLLVSIGSALHGVHADRVEVFVVLDGSTDGSDQMVAELARTYPVVLRWTWQPNAGRAAARNACLDGARGDRVWLLDDDMVVTTTALACHLAHDQTHASVLMGPCTITSDDADTVHLGAFYGERHRRLVDDGRVTRPQECSFANTSAPTALLRGRRFDERFKGFGLEDYELALRLLDEGVVITFDEAAEVHHEQPAAGASERRRRLVEEGINRVRFSRLHPERTDVAFEPTAGRAERLARVITRSPLAISLRSAAIVLGGAASVVSWRPVRNRLLTYAGICAVYDGVTRAGGRDLMPRDRGRLESAARAFVRPAVHRMRRMMLRPRIGHVRFGDLRRTTPIARDFGYARGGPVDRHYIEAFLEEQRTDVRGRVLEIGDDAYTRRFGGDHVTISDVLHANGDTPGATLGGDLADGSFLPNDAFDCVILTQTLHLIYDFRAALRTIERILAPGGVLLMTVPGISNIDPDEWGSTWHYQFTQHSVERMCAEAFPGWEVELASHGNILSVIAFLHGLGAGELTSEELAYHDPEYSLTHTARVVKPARPT